MSQVTRPRAHHYAVAHRVLPHLVFNDPTSVLRLFRSREATAFLRKAWTDVAARLPAGEPRLSSDGLHVLAAALPGGKPFAVVTLPPPARPGEAFYVGFVFEAGPRVLVPWRSVSGVRCFTLELASTATGKRATRLGGWTREGEHLDLGEGPPPDLGLFAGAVFARLGS